MFSYFVSWAQWIQGNNTPRTSYPTHFNKQAVTSVFTKIHWYKSVQPLHCEGEANKQIKTLNFAFAIWVGVRWERTLHNKEGNQGKLWRLTQQTRVVPQLLFQLSVMSGIRCWSATHGYQPLSNLGESNTAVYFDALRN